MLIDKESGGKLKDYWRKGRFLQEATRSWLDGGTFPRFASRSMIATHLLARISTAFLFAPFCFSPAIYFVYTMIPHFCLAPKVRPSRSYNFGVEVERSRGNLLRNRESGSEGGPGF